MYIRTGLGGVAIMLALGASPARALDTGQCLPAAQVRAALAAEGQTPIIVGNRIGYGYPVALIFTANADGSKGYTIRGDKSFGEQSATVCVESVYRDIRLNDITRPGIPAWAKMGGDARKAEDACKRERLGYQDECTYADRDTVSLSDNGQRVMLLATGTTINPRDKSVRENQRIIITLQATAKLELVRAVTESGSGYLLSGYSGGAYTPHGVALIRN